MTETAHLSDFSSKLHHVIKRVGLTSQVFIDQFAVIGGVRRAVPKDYLAGTREPYGATLDKLVQFLRRYAGGLNKEDFLLTGAHFEEAVERAIKAPKIEQAALPLPGAVFSEGDVKRLVGTYRLYRMRSEPTARGVVSEVMSIATIPNPSDGNKPLMTLRVRLWTKGGGDRFAYEGVVSLTGDQLNLMLSSGRESASATRLISFHSREPFKNDDGKPRKADTWVGLLMAPSEGPGGLTSQRVIIERLFDDPSRADDLESWRSLDAIDDVSKPMLLALTEAATVW